MTVNWWRALGLLTSVTLIAGLTADLAWHWSVSMIAGGLLGWFWKPIVQRHVPQGVSRDE